MSDSSTGDEGNTESYTPSIRGCQENCGSSPIPRSLNVVAGSNGGRDVVEKKACPYLSENKKPPAVALAVISCFGYTLSRPCSAQLPRCFLI